MACSLLANCSDSAGSAIPALICPETGATARRIVDVCAVCGERLAHRICDACDRRICKTCVMTGISLPLSYFCSSECRDEAELAAEQARQSDTYARWG